MARLSRKELDQLALKIVATDRALARGLLSASRMRVKSMRPGQHSERLVLLAASLSDALADSTPSPARKSS